MQECFTIARIISTYERASGQKINHDKIQISFSKNVPISLRQEITDHLGVVEVDRHEKYLGSPTIVARSKKAIFHALKREFGRSYKGGRRSSYLGGVRRF